MATTSLCPPGEDLQRFLLGQVTGNEAECLEEHLADCAGCLQKLAGLHPHDRLVDAVTAAARTEDTPAERVDENLLAVLYRLPSAATTTAQPGVSPSSQLQYSLESPEDFRSLLAPPQEPGEIGRFGPFSILNVLGAGGMGVVFAARQRRPNRIVALKMVAAEKQIEGRQLARFRGEAEIVARLRHPNIVPIYEAGDQEGRAYFTMEYVEGGSLAQKLAASPLEARAAAQLSETLARALGYAHEQSVVHRDLKPSNVLLTVAGIPKVGDFGLARQFGGETQDNAEGQTKSGTILGTPAYMAPEQATGQAGQAGPSADIYALGAILYECLTGRPPFRAATVLDTLDLVRRQEPVPPVRLQPNLPRDLQTICLKCLEKEPARRYASASALADDLGRFLRGEPIQARPVSRRERVLKWARRQPALAVLLGAGLLLLGVLVVGALVYESSLRAAVLHAEAKEAEALRQQERADSGYEAASAALNRMVARLEARPLGEVPQLKEFQRGLLEDALAYFQDQLGRTDDSDPRVQRDTARTCKRMGDIQQVLGRAPDAIKSYSRCLALLENQPAESSDGPDSRSLAAGCHNNLGLIAATARQWDEAKRHHQTALDIRDQILQAQPDNSGPRNGVAESEHNLAEIYQLTRKYREAEPHYGRAIAIRTELVRTHPREDGFQTALAQDCINLAEIYKSTKRVGDAVKTYERAEGLLRTILDREPARGEVALTLAALNINWSYILRAAGKAPGALTRLNEAVDLAEGVLRREPQHSHARHQTYNAHGARAQAHEALKRYADAVKDWDRVVELDRQPDAWIRQLFRTLAVARAGQASRAFDEAKALETKAEVTAEGRYNLVCVYALAAGAAGSNADLAERSAVQGIALLQKLLMAGYFKNVQRAISLMTDSDLDALRKRSDFKLLLRNTEASKPN